MERGAGGVRLAGRDGGGDRANVDEAGGMKDFDRGAGQGWNVELQATSLSLAGGRCGSERRDGGAEFVRSGLRQRHDERGSGGIPLGKDWLAVEQK